MERPWGWWLCWLHRRNIDDYRSWHGRRVLRVHESVERHLEDSLLQPTEFEDMLLDIMDFREAWPRLSPQHQRVLVLTADGLSDIEIAVRLGKTQNAIAQQKSLARRILRAACAVVV